MLHSYPTHSAALDPRFNPLLLPGVRNQSQPTASAGSSPHSEGVKTEMEPSSNSPVMATSVTWTPSALHGSLEVYDSGRYHKTNSPQSSHVFNFLRNSNFTFLVSLLQLLIKPKQRRQFGSSWCTEGLSVHTKKDLLCGSIDVWLQHQHCNVQCRLKAHESCTVHTTYYGWTQALDFGDLTLWPLKNDTKRLLALRTGGLFFSFGTKTAILFFFSTQCETKWFCFKSSILIHILFCTVNVCFYDCKCFFFLCTVLPC